jgi:trans-aconitate methyltransferase
VSGYVATAPDAYERSMGRWSALLAERFLDAVPLPPGAAVLDAGCGTGALAQALAARDPAARIAGTDLSDAFLAAARARVPGAAFRRGDIARLPDADGAFDAALSLLVLQFVPDRAAAAAELARVTRPGGIVAAAMWDFVGGFPFLRAVAPNDRNAPSRPMTGTRPRAQ